MPAARKLAVVSEECVACGCCMKVCPKGAIVVDRGMRAVVNPARCIGCGKCAVACPACVITMSQRKDNAQ
jgi:MinD superfamily P-loop ATPase